MAAMIKAGINPHEYSEGFSPVASGPNSQVTGSPDFFNTQRIKSHSIDQFSLQGDISRIFNDERDLNGVLSDQAADETQREERTMQRVCAVVKNPVFVFCVLAISGLYFVVCGL